MSHFAFDSEYLSVLKVIAPDKPIASAHWAYFLNKYHTKKFRLEAERRGYNVLLSDRAATDDQQFVVVFTAVGLLTPQCFLDQAIEAKKLVEEYGGNYDGYEHSATKADPDDESSIVVDYKTEPHWAVRV